MTDIEGDRDGLLSRELNSALSERTSFVMIEKANIQKVMDEQGWQLGNLVDPEARVKFGELLAAEGILFGQVLEWDEGLKSAKIRVHLQLDDVQRGSIVLSREFEHTAEAPGRSGLIALGAFLAAALLLAILLRKVLVRKKLEHIEDAVDHRQDALQQIRRAQQYLGDAREKVRRDGSPDIAEQVKAVEGDLDRLRLSIESAPAGRLFDREGLRLSDGDDGVDRRIVGSIRAIVGYCDRIYQGAQAGDLERLNKTLGEVRGGIKDAQAFFMGRQAG